MATTYNMAGMPVSGEWHTFDDVAEFAIGKRTAKTNGTVPIISSGAKPTGCTDTPSHPAGTITISFRGSVGNVYRWDMPIWANDCVVVTPKDGVDPDFLFYSLKVCEKTLVNIHDGGLIPRLDLVRVKKLPFFLPVMEDQLLLAGIVSELEQRTHQHLEVTQSRLNRLEKMFTQMAGDIFEYLRT